MSVDRTFALIKPDAVKRGIVGKIIDKIIEIGFSIVNIRKIHLTEDQGALFYAVHSDKPFFGDLKSFISSGPLYALVLEAEGAVKKWRDTMGATNPADAAEGTIRREFGTELSRNVVHGSDSQENSKIESSIFFSELELI